MSESLVCPYCNAYWSDDSERFVLHVVEEVVADSFYITCDPGDRSKIAREIVDDLRGAGFTVAPNETTNGVQPT
jgi:hypothetical protein